MWRIVFFVAAGIFFVGNAIFVVFGSGRLQPWNEVPTTDGDDDDDSKSKDKRMCEYSSDAFRVCFLFTNARNFFVTNLATSTDTVETADIADAVKSRS